MATRDESLGNRYSLGFFKVVDPPRPSIPLDASERLQSAELPSFITFFLAPRTQESFRYRRIFKRLHSDDQHFVEKFIETHASGLQEVASQYGWNLENNTSEAKVILAHFLFQCATQMGDCSLKISLINKAAQLGHTQAKKQQLEFGEYYYQRAIKHDDLDRRMDLLAQACEYQHIRSISTLCWHYIELNHTQNAIQLAEQAAKTHGVEGLLLKKEIFEALAKISTCSQQQQADYYQEGFQAACQAAELIESNEPHPGPSTVFYSTSSLMYAEIKRQQLELSPSDAHEIAVKPKR